MLEGRGFKFKRHLAVSPTESLRKADAVKLGAVLFDVDGTLAETERYGHRVSYNRAFRELGLGFRWSPQLYRELLEAPGGRERLLHYREHYKPDLGEYATQDPIDWARSVHRIKSRHFSTLLQQGEVPARPGVARLFREAAAAGVRIAVVTNASRASVDAVLRYALGAELQQQVELVVDGESVRNKKPNPEPYRLALQRLGLQPLDCVAIEDSSQGLRASTAAGVPTLVVQNEDTCGQDFRAAELVVDTLGEPGQRPSVLAGTLEEECVTLATLTRLLNTAATRGGRKSRAA